MHSGFVGLKERPPWRTHGVLQTAGEEEAGRALATLQRAGWAVKEFGLSSVDKSC